MSDLPDEVMKKARWEADNACIDATLDDYDGRGYLTPAEIVAVALDAAAPVLIEAERERIRARIRVEAVRLIAEAEAANTHSDWAVGVALHRKASGVRAAMSVIDEGKEA